MNAQIPPIFALYRPLVASSRRDLWLIYLRLPHGQRGMRAREIHGHVGHNAIALMLARLPDETDSLCDVLQFLGTAAIMVDNRGEVVGLNGAARDCIGAGLLIRNHRLVTVDPAANRALARLIAEPADGRSAHARAEDQVVVARPDSRPLILRIVRLRATSPFNSAHAIVMVLDPGRVVLPTEAQLRSAFGLSCGEARLAIRLAAGEPLESAAGSCGISYETARKRLKVAFEKTDTRRQSELVALVIRVGTLAGTAGVACARATPPRPRRPLPGGRAPVVHQPHETMQTILRDAG